MAPPFEWTKMPTQDKPIRIDLQADVLFDITKVQKIQLDVLKRLGCPACHSGFDIRFDLERDFIVDSNLNLRGF